MLLQWVIWQNQASYPLSLEKYCAIEDRQFNYGRVAEWFKAAVLKTAEVNSLREFESHLFRQKSLTGGSVSFPLFFLLAGRLLPEMNQGG